MFGHCSGTCPCHAATILSPTSQAISSGRSMVDNLGRVGSRVPGGGHPAGRFRSYRSLSLSLLLSGGGGDGDGRTAGLRGVLGAALPHFPLWLPRLRRVPRSGEPGFLTSAREWSWVGLVLVLLGVAWSAAPPGLPPFVSLPGPVPVVLGSRLRSGNPGPILPHSSGTIPGAAFGPYWLLRGRQGHRASGPAEYLGVSGRGPPCLSGR